MRDQTLHLGGVATAHPRVRLRGAAIRREYPGLGGQFALAALPDGTEVAYLDCQVRARNWTSQKDLVVAAGLGGTLGEALPPQA